MLDFNDAESQEAVFASHKEQGQIYCSNFKNQIGKFIATVVDNNCENSTILHETNRMQITATYIFQKKQVVGLKIQKFKKEPQPTETEITIEIKQMDVLIKFLNFLTSVDLESVSTGRLFFEENMILDPNLQSKLIALLSDEKGKKVLETLYESGMLTADLDVPELIKKGLSQDKINQKKNKLKEFEEVLESQNVKEVSDIQAWLKENPWFFGPEYKELDVRCAGSNGIPDFRLKRIDGLSDILEVKLPSVELLRADELGRQYIAPPLAEALGQLTGYLEYYYSRYGEEKSDSTYEEIEEDTFENYYKPKGILLIGRRFKAASLKTMSRTIDATPKKLRRLLSYYHWIEVLTYDDLIERAKNSLNKLTQ